jgi:starch phosphorylase
MKETNPTQNELCLLPVMEPLPVDADAIRRAFDFYLTHHRGHFLGCSEVDVYQALAVTIRDRLMSNWRNTWRAFTRPGTRRACYLSLEFLMGRALGNHLLNLRLRDAASGAMQQHALTLEEIESEEVDAGLGNGGLGRLAACFMDSCASLQLPVIGYGIRYQYGMFHQHIRDGYQVEDPDHWLRDGFPWEIERPEFTQVVRFGGRVEHYRDTQDRPRMRLVETDDVLAIPYDVPISGYANDTVNTLRLWSSAATDEFNLHEFNSGSYTEAVADKNNAEHITMVLYPNDSSENGKELRLRQQYFLASASIQDMLAIWEQSEGEDWDRFTELNVFQMNDTHPTIAVAELMRILLDEKGLQWDRAWDITCQCMAYTNHTLLPEALETWPVSLMESLIPRHVQIIYEINRRFMDSARRHCGGDTGCVRRMSILSEDGNNRFRMANLAIIGSHKVNGVAKLHTELLRTRLVKDFAETWPDRFIGITNGITPRRWLLSCNPRLAEAITGRIGDQWPTNLDLLSRLAEFADDPAFQDEFLAIKRANKRDLGALVEQLCGVKLDSDSIFDVQIKRLHEYKRQLLNIMHVIWRYQRMKENPKLDLVPRSFIFGAKAAPSYHMAKLIIRLINGVAEVVNADPDVAGRIRVAFLPDYRVTLAEKIIPAADISEQISTAGMEASGTGNMKLALNGALTIGTFDGANIEILNAVGAENIFVFGLTADEVEELHTTGTYDPWEVYAADRELAAVIDAIHDGTFARSDTALLRGIWSALMDHGDHYMHLADFRAYLDAQQRAEELYTNRNAWAAAAIRNVAAMGYFSSDRTIREYSNEIWHLEPVSIDTEG